MTIPKSPEEALAVIQAAAQTEDISFANDSLCDLLDSEIQEIYVAIRIAEKGQAPQRGLWMSDGQRISIVMPLGSDGRATPEAGEAVKRAGVSLGIELDIQDKWEDAALRLREKRSTGPKS